MSTTTFVPFAPISSRPSEPVLMITPEARAQLEHLLRSSQDAGGTLRIAVVGGGCSGLSYLMEFTPARPGDQVDDRGWIQLAVDSSAVNYLAGTTLHFDGGLNGRGFIFSNPNARRTCSCGDSFAV